MAEDGKIIYRVEVDSSDAVSEARAGGERAGAAMRESAEKHGGPFENIWIGAARRIGEAFVNMSAQAVKGIEQMAQTGIEFNAKMETYQTAFTTLIGDAEQAAAAIEQIRKDAASTPFDVDSLTAANQALLATGMDAGAARKDVLNLANAIAATGGGSAELSRMAANMQQIRNTGKATAMDIRQFANAGINIYGLLADSMGVTVEEAAEMDVTYEQLTAAFEKASAAGGAYEGAMEAQSQTFNGRISTLKDNATQLAGALTEDLFSQLSGGALPMVMDWVATLLEAAQTGGIEGAWEAAKGILSGIVDSLLENLPTLLDTGMTMLESLLNGMASSADNVIDVIGSVITMILSAFVEHLPELLQAGANLLVAVIQGLLQQIPKVIEVAAQLIAQLLKIFFTGQWIEIGNYITEGIGDGIRQAWDTLVQWVKDAVNRLWTAAKNALGIRSPSKKFKYIGEMSVEGMEEGFEDKEVELDQTVNRVYNGMLDAASVSGLERGVSYNLTANGTTGDRTIVVPLSIDGREIARATAWQMGEQLAWEEM